MKENLLDVLMYLFENYIYDEPELDADRDSVQIKLLEAGFLHTDIDRAFQWLDDLNTRSPALLAKTPSERAIRLFAPEETERLNSECQGFLLFLEQIGVLTLETRELIIDRVMALSDAEEFDLEQLKWVILMILFNRPGEEAAYAWMEDLVFESFTGYLH